MEDSPAYGLWSLVIINSLVFVIFAFSFSKPQTQRDWRTFGAFSAFIVALFVEMYGFPLTIYLIVRVAAQAISGCRLFPMTQAICGTRCLVGPIRTLIRSHCEQYFDLWWIHSARGAWKVLFEAQRTHTLTTTGPYAYVRHPQYAGFILIMFGFLLQWPTLITLVMFPILVTMYVKLAQREDGEVLEEFGEQYRRYAALTPAFFPHLGNRLERKRA